MTLNQKTCRLFHFDRDGAKYTPPIDYHVDAETFVRLTLGISSLDEDVLGFDTSIKWEIDSNGRKSKGTITVATDATNPDKDAVYTLCEPQPESRTFTIIGRGTTYWRATANGIVPDAPGFEVMVKFSWRADDRIAEDIFLTGCAAGIRGIAKLITKRDEEWSTREMRDDDMAHDDSTWFGSCLVFEAPGDPISDFTSQRQLLRTIRDVLSSMVSSLSHHRSFDSRLCA